MPIQIQLLHGLRWHGDNGLFRSHHKRCMARWAWPLKLPITKRALDHLRTGKENLLPATALPAVADEL